MWLPQTIIAQSSATLSTGQNQAPVPTGINPNLPKIITNPNSSATPPEGMSPVQLGFVFQLNYPFVVSNPLSSAQIFLYLPQGVAGGLQLDPDHFILHCLYPLDTTARMGFVTTAAMAYIPSNMIDTLRLNLGTPSSPLYNNADVTVNTLTSYLNPAIPLIPGQGAGDGSSTGTGTGSAPTNTAGGNNGVFNTDSQNTSPGVKGTTAGIAMGCVGAASAYGAAMFLLARRYKKRKQAHRRTSSVASHSEMRQSTSPGVMSSDIFMSGGRMSPGGTTIDRNSRGSGGGNSGRTQQISAPMMAENSLGWN
jgi:hypothetical protein